MDVLNLKLEEAKEKRRQETGFQEEDGLNGIIMHTPEEESAGRQRDQGEKVKGGRQGGKREDSRHSSGGEAREERRPQCGERALVKMEMY